MGPNKRWNWTQTPSRECHIMSVVIQSMSLEFSRRLLFFGRMFISEVHPIQVMLPNVDFARNMDPKPCQKIFGPARGRNSWQRNWLLWCVRELSKKHHPSSDKGRFGDMRSGSRKSRDGSFRNQHVSCFTRIAQVLQWMTVESSFSPLCEPKLQFFSGNLPIVSKNDL